MSKKFYTTPIKAYQYFSKMIPANCRYYPSCSEYAKWQFEFNRPHRAFFSSGLRILRCNQFFKGGIDYPLVEYKNYKNYNLLFFNRYCGKIKIIYWFIPKSINKNNRYFYVIKDFDAINHSIRYAPPSS